MAYPLTALSMSAHDGPAPLFLIDANTAGAGKGLLAAANSIIVTGAEPAPTPYPRDDEEMRKRITSLAQAGRQMVHLDNLAGPLGCPSLDACLTAVVWSDRLLGTNKTIEIPFRAVWSATGNNVILTADTSRRTCWVRLESPEEKPDERSDFRHPNLRKYVFMERPRLLAAALTILRGFFAAGRPDQGLKTWGSFEEWSDIVRNTLVWVGLADPGETRVELRSQSDKTAFALRAIVENLDSLDDDGKGVTASAIARAIADDHRADFDPGVMALREAFNDLCGARAKPNSFNIGKKLRLLKGRVVGGKCIDGQPRQGTYHWFIADLTSRNNSKSANNSTYTTETVQSHGLGASFGGDGGDGGDSGVVLPHLYARESHLSRVTHAPAYIAGGNNPTIPTIPTDPTQAIPHVNGATAKKCFKCKASAEGAMGGICTRCARLVCFVCRSNHECLPSQSS